MKIPLILIVIIAAVLGAIFMLAPEPDPKLTQARTDLPWQITLNPDGSSRVFDLDLGSASLQDAIDKFGPPEGLAVFQHKDNSLDLEVYFGKVAFGPLNARVVTQLAADPAVKKTLAEQASKRESSPTGDWKFKLHTSEQKNLLQNRIIAISYVPGTRRLDQTFFLERFGTPEAQLAENEHARSWFYPAEGLSILIDEKGPEVLEYVAPRDFRMPPDTEPYR